MKGECTTIVANKYLFISYHCSDGRLRYPTSIKAQDDSPNSAAKLQNIKKLANDYISKFILMGDSIIKADFERYLNMKLRPGKAQKGERDLIKDHAEMIREMREGKLLKRKSKAKYSLQTIAQYERMCARWQECTADPDSNFKLNYSMTIDSVKNLISWLVQKEYAQNSVYDIINNLQIFLRYAKRKGYHQNDVQDNREFTVAQETSDAIAPTYDEILTIYNHKFDMPGMERARDFFVYGCFLALRVRDLQKINDYKLCGDVFEVFTQKGGKRVVIPCHWIAKEIYNKYDGIIPVSCRQHLARYLPKICKAAGISGTKLIVYTEGGVKKEIQYNRQDLFTPHTMRRFFATWMYKDLRRQPREIMPITGHESEESFFRYIKIELEMNAEEILNDPAFRKPAGS